MVVFRCLTCGEAPDAVNQCISCGGVVERVPHHKFGMDDLKARFLV